jgi:hypothetical protein
MLMERNAEIIRGWPYDGARDRAETISSGATLQNGNWVQKQSDGTVMSGGTAANNVGLVFEGNGDSASAANANMALVLWGNFIAKIANYDNTQTYAPGNNVTCVNGVITLATGSNPVVGQVLDVVSAVTTGLFQQTAHLTISVA